MASFSSIGIGLGGNVDVNELIKASVDAVSACYQAEPASCHDQRQRFLRLVSSSPWFQPWLMRPASLPV